MALKGFPKDPLDRQKLLLEQLSRLQKKDLKESWHPQYLTVLALVVHQLFHPELKEMDIDKGLRYAKSLLQSQKTKGEGHAFSSLYQDLYLLHSQSLRLKGQHFLAAWFSAVYFREQSAGGWLQLGNRLLRLGYGKLSCQAFCKARELGAPEHVAFLGHTRALRMMGQYDLALKISEDLLRKKLLPRTYQLEFEWQKACLELSMGADPTHFVGRLRSREFRKTGYILEGTLLILTHRQKSAAKKLPSLTYLRKKSPPKTPHEKRFRKAVEALVQCYQSEQKLPDRLCQLGQALAQCPDFFNLEEELLYWAAAARFLKRIRAYQPLAITLTHYHHLSLKLSDGATSDVLGTTKDLTMESP